MLRLFLGLAAGVVVAFVAMTALQVVGFLVFPPPAGLNPADPDDVKLMLAAASLAAKAWVVFSWFAAALAGGWLARRLSRRDWGGWVIAGMIVLGGIFNLIEIPHPLWMQIATFAAPLLGGWLVTLLPVRGADPVS
jgi:hypothetical protein